MNDPDPFDRAAIERRQTERLRDLLREIASSNPFWQAKYRAAGVDPRSVQTLADLRRLPFCTKWELIEDQATHPPYGTNLTYPLERYNRMHQTSGTTAQPLRWLDTPESWQWVLECWGQIYELAGLTAADRMCAPFSFGPFIGFWAAFEGAARLGMLCLAGGGMSTSARLRLIVDHQATVVCCTPTYALRMADVAREERIDLAGSSVRALIVAGEPGGAIPGTRSRIETAWKARVFDHWGMTELGSLACECVENAGSMHLLESECIAEVIDPATGEPVEPGQIGELVITNLGRTGSPLIRYRTGDLVEPEDGRCSCGRWSLRLKGGILGRADDMVIIRGNNVFPSTIEAILRDFTEVTEFRIEVHTIRSMPHLRIQVEPSRDVAPHDRNTLADRIEAAIRDRLNFRAEVVAVLPGTLPRFELKGRRFFRVT
ncbi:MAG: phenylacetate--CoA ligase [Planctomycetes bacterium]|nr:phenylacetate--CoA ligase [Planctomycetota bacterium]